MELQVNLSNYKSSYRTTSSLLLKLKFYTSHKKNRTSQSDPRDTGRGWAHPYTHPRTGSWVAVGVHPHPPQDFRGKCQLPHPKGLHRRILPRCTRAYLQRVASLAAYGVWRHPETMTINLKQSRHVPSETCALEQFRKPATILR